MQILSSVITLIVAVLHFYFLILEMFLWQKPVGLKTFRNTPQKAAESAVLAANQGLYNGFLSAGLITSLFLENPASLYFKVYFLTCVVIAGLYGAYSVSKRIFYIQALPALIGLLAIYFS